MAAQELGQNHDMNFVNEVMLMLLKIVIVCMCTFGLGAYLFTVDPNLATRMAAQRQLQTTDTLCTMDNAYSNSGGAVMVAFRGVNLKPCLVPILHNISTKYGEVFEGSLVRSHDVKATAYESVVKVLALLQSTSVEALTDQQAEYLASTMSDLKLMRIKVDWLVPFVDKAIALQKNKSLVAALMDLEKATAIVEELKEKFLADGGSELTLKHITSGPIDLKETLGDGLW